MESKLVQLALKNPALIPIAEEYIIKAAYDGAMSILGDNPKYDEFAESIVTEEIAYDNNEYLVKFEGETNSYIVAIDLEDGSLRRLQVIE